MRSIFGFGYDREASGFVGCVGFFFAKTGVQAFTDSGLDGPSWASALPLTHVRPQISDHLVRQGHE